MRIKLLALVAWCGLASSQSVFPPGGSGTGVGAANVVAETASSVASLAIDISSLSLTTATQNTLLVDCYSGTGFSGGHVTGPLTRLTYATPFLSSRTLTSVTANWTPATANILCVANSNGGAGATGATGSTGLPGQGLTWRGTWSSVTAYTAYDIVSLAGSSYIAVASSTNVTPGTDGTKWALMAQSGTGGGATIPAVTNFIRGAGDGNGADSGKAVPSGTVVGSTDTQTLTNKTLNSPVINTPSGLDKSDVGLSLVPNVDARARSTHSGTQTASTISDFSAAASSAAALANT